MALNLDKLTRDTQKQVDDCSGDYHYAGASFGHLPFHGGVILGDANETLRRTKTLAYVATQQASAYRANARGRGKVVIAFRLVEEGAKLELLVDAVMNAQEAMQWLNAPKWPVTASPLAEPAPGHHT